MFQPISFLAPLTTLRNLRIHGLSEALGPAANTGNAA
jgi:hypothetical protein